MKTREIQCSTCLRAAVAVVFCLLLLLTSEELCEAINDEQLSDKLAEIRSRSFQEPSDYALAETDALKLLGLIPTASATGKVYLAIEKVYAKSIEAHPEKVAEYCEKSLQTAPDAAASCKLYADWGSALERQIRSTVSIGDSAKGRREVVRPFLRAWSIIFTNDVPETLQDLPAVGKYRYAGPTTDEAYLAMAKQRDAEWAARERARIKNELVLCRARIVSDNIAQLYRGQSGIADLRADALEELHDPVAVEGLVERVQKFKNEVAR
jgi:hypothetical protein